VVKLNKGWQFINFDEVFEDVTRHFVKIPTNCYKLTGTYAIVDQGQAFIAGYTDLDLPRNSCNPPCIIFGDHTRIFKYVDFDFFIGADGVKVLKLKIEGDEKYLYHFLNSVLIESCGYSRHFKFLKRIRIPLPPLPEQQRIAAILDKADEIRRKRETAIAKLDQLAQSIFVEMFGERKTNPKNYVKHPLCKISEISTGSTPSRNGSGLIGGTINWVKTTEVNGNFIGDTEEKLTVAGLKSIRGKLHPVDSIIVAMYGQGKTRGRTAMLTVESACNQACGVIRPNNSFSPKFMFWQLQIAYSDLRSLGRGGNQENMNLNLLGQFEVLIPPLPLQQQFANRINQLEQLKTKQQTALSQQNQLFATLQHQAFTGQL